MQQRLIFHREYQHKIYSNQMMTNGNRLRRQLQTADNENFRFPLRRHHKMSAITLEIMTCLIPLESSFTTLKV